MTVLLSCSFGRSHTRWTVAGQGPVTTALGPCSPVRSPVGGRYATGDGTGGSQVRRHVGRRRRPHAGGGRTRSPHPARAVTTSSWSSRPWARRPTSCIRTGRASCPTTRRVGRWTCSSPPASARPAPSCAWRSTRSGVPAVSFTGSQAGFRTDTNHTNARIVEVRPDRIRAALDDGLVPVVGGSQGVSTDHDVTFLGRGGSDTTAVALAEALDADACELYTDVSGVFTTDPQVVPEARKMDRITFDELLEMTATGCPKPAMRSVEFARTHGVPLHVRSAFTWEPGHLGRVRGGEDRHGTADHPGRHPGLVRGQGDRQRRGRRAGHRRRAVPGPGRPAGQRGHDRPERVRARASPTSRSPCPTRTCPWALGHPREAEPRSWGPPASPRTARSHGSASSGPE